MSKMPQPVIMDSRKFLSSINDSAQAKVALFESHVRDLGKQIGKNWKLAALHAKDLFIEDTDTHDYYTAKHMRDKNRINITDICPIKIVEEEKQSLFAESARRLIEAISTNDQSGMKTAFEKLKGQRFSSRSIPFSGVVRCKDGVRRFVNVENGHSLDESTRNKLVATIVEGLNNNIIVENGHVVAGVFNSERVKLPVTKWGARKLVARRGRDLAINAYMSEGFQNRILNVARFINEGKIEEAVKSIGPFLDEMEEFTLLTRKQTQTLIENTLAAKCVFNQRLCDDTATLFHRTNMKLSRNKIVNEWRNIAIKTEQPVLANNVHLLEEATNFENAHSKFLTLIFETISNKDVTAEALATTLNVLKDRTPKIRESFELSTKLDGLIRRLKQNNIDDAAIYEAEDLIATIQEELAATDTLSNYDQMPSDVGTPNDQIDDPLAGSIGSDKTPIININSPLIQIGGSSGTGENAKPEPIDDKADESEGDPELDALLGNDNSQQPAPPAPPPPAPPAPQAGQQNQPITQGLDRGNENSLFESTDPYYFKLSNDSVSDSSRFHDYGSPIITNDSELNKITAIMRQLAVEHKLTGNKLTESLDELAKASIKAVGLRIPAGKLPGAITQAISVFKEEWKKPWLKDEDESDEIDEIESNDEDEEDDGFVEDQMKTPLRKPRGFARSSFKKRTPVGKTEGQRSVSEGINWLESDTNGMLGEIGGVKFVFDHGGDSNIEPAILSEDGQVEIPIPKALFNEAYAAANMSEGSSNKFVRWLAGSIEQLRPLSEDESDAISEAVATITASPDGSLSVEVTPDVDVDEMSDIDDGFGDEMGDEDGFEDGMDDDGIEDDGMEEPGEFGSEEVDDFGSDDAGSEMDFDSELGDEEMQPVDATDVDGESDLEDEDNQDLDFENDGMDENPSDFKTKEVEFEDKDITAPPSSKYTKHVKENLRTQSKPETPADPGDDLESIGPDLTVDDGSGTKPKFAKKGDNK